MNVWVWIGVALLSGIAAIGRFLVIALVSSRGRGSFPLGTFAVNTTGALLLGLITGLAVEGDALVLLGAATLGSYTTFSTWMLESQRLTEEGQIPVAAINILLSLAVGVGAVALGRLLGTHLR
jgi:fluoride exporter